MKKFILSNNIFTSEILEKENYKNFNEKKYLVYIYGNKDITLNEDLNNSFKTIKECKKYIKSIDINKISYDKI